MTRPFRPPPSSANLPSDYSQAAQREYPHHVTGGTQVYFEGEVRMCDAPSGQAIGDDGFHVPRYTW